MKEQLISFDTAKLAKEKGFNLETLHFWTTNKKPYISKGFAYMSDAYTKSNWNNGQGSYPTLAKDVECSAPTQSLLQKWLREVHNVHVTSHCKNTKNPKGTYTSTVEINNETEYYHFGYNTFEEALEIGLQKALKLLP